MALYLTVDAQQAGEFRIEATGREAELCARVSDSLILTTYRDLLREAGCSCKAIELTLHNEIPLGIGCGSSAAALLAGILLANHFGQLGWSDQQVLEEAYRREGHPDNVAACWRGGMTSSAVFDGAVITATCGLDIRWNLLIAVPSVALATEKARALLPATYSRADAVANVQSTALLVSAFALKRGDLLRHAMQDHFHQPYRMELCPLLPKLLPLVADSGVLGIALSGAGPAVLLVAEEEAQLKDLITRIRLLGEDSSLEVIRTRIASGCIKEP